MFCRSTQDRTIPRIQNSANIGYVPMKHEVDKQDQSRQNRVKLLQLCQDGEKLTLDEFKFLAYTSKLLNENIDKRFIHNVLVVLDEQVLDEIELKIADHIITRYYLVLEEIKKQRFTYLRDVLQHQKQEFRQFDKAHERELVARSKRMQLMGLKKKICQILSLKRKHNKKVDQLKVNKYVKAFAYKLLEKIGKKPGLLIESALSDNFLTRNLDDPEKKVMFTLKDKGVTVHELRRKFHPSSKIILTPAQLI